MLPVPHLIPILLRCLAITGVASSRPQRQSSEDHIQRCVFLREQTIVVAKTS